MKQSEEFEDGYFMKDKSGALGVECAVIVQKHIRDPTAVTAFAEKVKVNQPCGLSKQLKKI